MKRLLFAVSAILWTLAVVPAMAKDLETKPTEAKIISPGTKTISPGEKMISPGELTPTPEMWFYQQYQQQFENAKEMVHQRSDYRADQRLQRLTAMRWFGLSNQRPQMSADIINGDASPGWIANSSAYPYRWQGYSCPIVIVPSGGK